MNYQIIEYENNYKVIKHIPDSQVHKAMQIVKDALHGKLCFKWVNLSIYKNNESAVGITVKNFELDQKQLYYRYRFNYDKIKWALQLLSKLGIINSYTILGTGVLKVNWFYGYVHIHVKSDNNRILLEKLQIFYENNKKPHYKLLKWWEYYPVKGFNMNLLIDSYIFQTFEVWDYNRKKIHEKQLELQRILWKEERKDTKKQERAKGIREKVNKLKLNKCIF